MAGGASIWRQTHREKVGTIDGINLFFGALLGANLGALDSLATFEYAKLIVLLAGLVVTIRMVTTSERRLYAVATLLFYVALFAAVLLLPRLQPEGMAIADLHRLGATLAIWVTTSLIFEFFPTGDPHADDQAA